jgi:hypothetical protein
MDPTYSWIVFPSARSRALSSDFSSSLIRARRSAMARAVALDR